MINFTRVVLKDRFVRSSFSTTVRFGATVRARRRSAQARPAHATVKRDGRQLLTTSAPAVLSVYKQLTMDTYE